MREYFSKAVMAGTDLLRTLPLEIRRQDDTLVERTTVARLASTLNTLSAGDYIFSVALPVGTRISQQVRIDEHGAVDVTKVVEDLKALPSVDAFLKDHLVTMLGETARSGFDDAMRFVRRHSSSFNAAVVRFGVQLEEIRHAPDDHLVKVRAFGITDSVWSEAASGAVSIEARGSGQRIRSEAGVRLGLQVLRAGHAALNVVLPAGSDLVLSAPVDADRSIAAAETTVDLGVGLINELQALRMEGRLDEVATVSQELHLSEIEGFEAQRVGAATLAMYVLLRTGERQGAAELAGRLVEKGASADAHVVLAETAALSGRHRQALAELRAAGEVGLPDFSYGLNYMTNRMRFYIQCRASGTLNTLGLEPGDPDGLDSLFERAQGVSLFTDFSEPTLTFTGLDPSDPDDERLSEEVVAALSGQTVRLRRTAPPAKTLPLKVEEANP
ncbi:hypothetical protein [Methylobacterium sp. 17Sr1-1]|uniref:hypothetical protein n=1 Tax=Methylobacterium sp. 17Sr1-1 TaxID=2202826 RepID=UPI000D6EF584|nr:hypothetical protein [Methylobacterium sp. 17Sr1-1]AWN52161.1 hypothetical protein DK412_11165 [Methylobacterium sp. 17Sr1-1]